MGPVKRIIVNTVCQYAKSLVNICLSLYSTRLILEALSVSDYGVYSVVGGVVAMLGFMTNALIITTQRYISYHHNDLAYVSKLFSNSLFLHFLIGASLGIILFLPESWLINNVLNIGATRLGAASHVYEISVFMLFLTIVTAPFKALFIARENIVYISIVEVFDGLLKLSLAILLMYVPADKLLCYACGMALILVVNFLAFVVYAVLRFEECHIVVRKKDLDRECMARLTGFAGWMTYGMGAVAARNQGIAVILNHFLGTIVNAAYGIAFQVYAAVSFVSTSILNAMNPQIMKSEGEHDRRKTLFLAERESKYSTTLLALVAIPMLVEMPAVLALWLKDYPEGTVLFCRSVLIASLLDQLTYGLQTANQALGKVRDYTLLIYTPKLLTPVGVWLLLVNGYGIRHVMWLYISVELAMAMVRLPFMKYTAGLSIRHYFSHVVLPLLPLCIVLCGVSWICGRYGMSGYWIVVNILVSILAGGAAVWFFTLESKEREFVRVFIKSRWVNVC